MPVLDLMRKHARSWFIKVALGAIIVTFVFIYGYSGPEEKSRNYVADVNGTVITADYFYKVYESELEKIRLRFGGSLPPDLLEKLNLKKSVVQGLVNQTLLLQEADRLGFMVTDEDVVRTSSNPFSTENSISASRAHLNVSSIIDLRKFRSRTA
jgi:peptidyl-prolyl cis-trans isomerase D